MWLRETQPIKTTLLANSVGMGKTFTCGLVIRMYYESLLTASKENRDFIALPTAYGLPANLVAQTFAELTDAFPGQLNIKVVYGTAAGCGQDTRRAENTLDPKELDKTMRGWMDNTHNPEVS